MLLLTTGITHSVIGLVAGRAALAGMASDGFWMAALASEDRQRVTWFLMAGCMFLLSGCRAQQFGRPLPASFAWLLGGVALFGAVTFDPSGFFLVIPQALFILIVSRGLSGAQVPAGSTPR